MLALPLQEAANPYPQALGGWQSFHRGRVSCAKPSHGSFLHSLHIVSTIAGAPPPLDWGNLLTDFCRWPVYNGLLVDAWHFRHFSDYWIKSFLDPRDIRKLVGDEPIDRESVLVEGGNLGIRILDSAWATGSTNMRLAPRICFWCHHRCWCSSTDCRTESLAMGTPLLSLQAIRMCSDPLLEVPRKGRDWTQRWRLPGGHLRRPPCIPGPDRRLSRSMNSEERGLRLAPQPPATETEPRCRFRSLSHLAKCVHTMRGANCVQTALSQLLILVKSILIPPPMVTAACFPGAGLLIFAFVDSLCGSFHLTVKDCNTLMPFSPVITSPIPDGTSFLNQ